TFRFEDEVVLASQPCFIDNQAIRFARQYFGKTTHCRGDKLGADVAVLCASVRSGAPRSFGWSQFALIAHLQGVEVLLFRLAPHLEMESLFKQPLEHLTESCAVGLGPGRLHGVEFGIDPSGRVRKSKWLQLVRHLDEQTRGNTVPREPAARETDSATLGVGIELAD